MEYDFDNQLLKYIVEYPYMSNQEGQEPDGNPILYFALAMYVRGQYFPFADRDAKLIKDLYADVKIEPGLICRSRFKKEDHEAHDDYIGLCYLSYFASMTIANEIVAYGRAHNWMYNNTKIKWPWAIKCWHWRLFGTIQHYKLAAGIGLNFLDKFLWAASIYSPSGDESGINLQTLKVDLYINQKHRSWIMDFAVNHWQTCLYTEPKYPFLIGSVFEIYFGKNHILARWMQGLMFRRR